MILPRRLMTLADGSFCEEDDPKQAMNFRPKGYPISDTEAARIGLKAYLDATGWGEKAHEKGERKVTEAAFEKSVAQAETEDKAVAGPEEAKAEEPTGDQPKSDETEADPGPGLHVDRGQSRGRRGG
jgi:hypothetical protein